MIVNDREFGGKCYGFVTFTNTRAIVKAINDMDGKAIGGRTIRVNEVKSKSSRATFARENHFRDRIRDRDRDEGREDWDRVRTRSSLVNENDMEQLNRKGLVEDDGKRTIYGYLAKPSDMIRIKPSISKWSN